MIPVYFQNYGILIFWGNVGPRTARCGL